MIRVFVSSTSCPIEISILHGGVSLEVSSHQPEERARLTGRELPASRSAGRRLAVVSLLGGLALAASVLVIARSGRDAPYGTADARSFVAPSAQAAVRPSPPGPSRVEQALVGRPVVTPPPASGASPGTAPVRTGGNAFGLD